MVSGGHTQLVLANAFDSYRIIIDTLDTKVGSVRSIPLGDVRYLSSGIASDAFDKVARSLCLPADTDSGPGAILEYYASLPPLPPFDKHPLPPLPQPLSTGHRANQLAFSFSGLVSATERVVDNLHEPNVKHQGHQGDQERIEELEAEQRDGIGVSTHEARQREVARVFQNTAIEHILQKTRMAMVTRTGLDSLVVSGGVACNSVLRRRRV